MNTPVERNKMRESCSCGAGIHSFSRDWIREWRTVHRCDPRTLLDALEKEVEQVYVVFDDDEGE